MDKETREKLESVGIDKYFRVQSFVMALQFCLGIAFTVTIPYLGYLHYPYSQLVMYVSMVVLVLWMLRELLWLVLSHDQRILLGIEESIFQSASIVKIVLAIILTPIFLMLACYFPY